MVKKIDCDTCGAVLPQGMGSLLCPVCLLSDEEEDQAESGRLRIGSCVIHHEIARGGMGVVYYAEQIDLGRVVALKVLLGQVFSSAEARERFRAESAAAAKLRHTGIVAIHEFGEHNGNPYFTMDFIKGVNLEEMMRKEIPPSHFSAQLCQSLAKAVHYAHGEGVYHRDLKPSNILIDEANQPILTDFGLARTRDQDSKLTLSGQLVGTPSYMPPERAAGLPSSIVADVSGDVYGLGAILYHLLTGRPPFLGESIPLTLNAVIHDEPVAPHRLRPGLHRDLETICLKCLQKNTHQRYASAGEVADDLGRFMNGESINASPVSVATLIFRRIRRHPAVAALTFALVLSMLGGVIATFRESRGANVARSVAENIAENLQREVYATDVLAASIALDKDNPGNARRHLERHLPTLGSEDIRGFEWHYLSQRCKGREHATLREHQHIVTSLEWSPDGRRLASADHSGKLILWQRSEDQKLLKSMEFTFKESIHKLAWLSDSKKLIISGPQESTSLIDASDGSTLHSWAGTCFALSSNNLMVAVSRSSPFHYQHAGDVTLYALPGGQKIRTVADAGRALAFSPDGDRLAVAIPKLNDPDNEKGIRIYHLNHPENPPLNISTNYSIWALQFSPDGRKLASNTNGGSAVFLWDTSTGNALQSLEAHTQRVWSCSFIESGKKIITTGSDRTIRLWDAESLSSLPLTNLNGHENEVWCASLNSAGGLLATGDKSGEICLWEWPPNEEAKPELPKTAYTDSFFSRDSQKLFVSNHPTAGNSFTSAYDFSNQKNHSYDFPQMPIGTDAQGNLIVLMKESSTLEFFTPDGKTLVKKIKLAIDQLSLNINHVRQGVNKQGTRFYWLSRDNTQIHYVDFSTGKCAYYSGLPAAECIGATISYDGRWIAAASWDHLHVYDTTTQTLKTIPNERHWASAMAFHPDHKRLITAGIDGTLRIHSLPDLTVIATLRGHLENANGIAISPDGLTIASVENDAGIKLWRLDTLREVVDLKIPNTMGEIFFSPDGSRLAFSVRDKAGGAAIQVLEAK